MHHINVDRNNGAPSYVAALKALNSGEIIGIFPEATISTSFEIKQLKSGALRLAVDAGVPIIPTIVWGGQRVSTKGVKPNFKRGKTPVSVTFGEQITYAKDADIEAAQLHLREVMISMLREVQEKYPDSHVGQRWAPARLGGTAPAPLK
jgi:1-acyl-sn-glycerol-3-phosphate acyltransferase